MSDKRTCPFCNLQDRVLKDNRHANMFLSNPRKMPGHTLITPKRHVEKPWELTDDELLSIFELIYFAQRQLAKEFSQGCDVRQNYRPFLQQSRLKVDHVHFHVMPRDFEDELYQKVEKHETDMFKDITPEEHDKIAKIFII